MKKYEAMVLSCMDPRFQPKVFNYLKKKKLTGKYSSFTIAGSAIGVTSKKFKEGKTKIKSKLSGQFTFLILLIIIIGLIVYSVNDLLFN